MKTLLVMVLILGSFTAMADCSLVLKAKKIDALSGKINGVSISKKQVQALRDSGCNVEIKLMSRDELVADATLAIDKRLAKKELESKK